MPQAAEDCEYQELSSLLVALSMTDLDTELAVLGTRGFFLISFGFAVEKRSIDSPALMNLV
jgi:hypothetical protein